MMKGTTRLWLVANPASGSSDAASLAALHDTIARTGFTLAGETAFPEDDLPTPATLDEAGAEWLVVHAGDGTLNSALRAFAGWQGAVLVLPGGTRNLLHRRLFGMIDSAATLELAAQGRLERQRPWIIAGPGGQGLAGVMVGPATAWQSVREALRDADLLAAALEARKALAQTMAGQMVACREPAIGRREGYPLLQLLPQGEEIAVQGYFADSAVDVAEQGLAVLKGDFRDGPHVDLGRAAQLVIDSGDGGALQVLYDGEKASERAPLRLRLDRCPVDLLAPAPAHG